MFCGLNARKIIALYLILKIWLQNFEVSSFHFCSVYYKSYGAIYKKFQNHLYQQKDMQTVYTLLMSLAQAQSQIYVILLELDYWGLTSMSQDLN